MDVATWELCLCLFVYGMGVGMATAQLTSLLLHDVPVEESGQASGLQSSVRQLGSALGVAVLGGLLIGTLGRATEANLTALSVPPATVDSVTTAVSESAGTAIAGLQAQPDLAAVAQAASDAMITASRLTTAFAAVALVIGLLATFRLPRTALVTRPGEAPEEGSAPRADDHRPGHRLTVGTGRHPPARPRNLRPPPPPIGAHPRAGLP